MGQKRDLATSEKSTIVSELGKGKTTLEISKILKRDHRTVKKFVESSAAARSRSDKGVSRTISRRTLSRVTREVVKNPSLNSKEIFKRCGRDDVSKATRCRTLRKVSKHVKPVTKPPLKTVHKQNRLKWAEDYMKTDFSKVLFTDECRATLDGPDGWCKGWVAVGRDRPHRLRRQQGGGGVMFWAGIVGNMMVGPWKVPDGVKMTSLAYIDFLKDNFQPWFKKQKLSFKRSLVFMQDNAPSHAAKKTIEYLQQSGFHGPRLMKWPACSPDINPIENMWSVLKRRVYQGGRQFSTKSELWDAVVNAAESITPDEILSLTNSMDNRVRQVIAAGGGYIKH